MTSKWSRCSHFCHIFFIYCELTNVTFRFRTKWATSALYSPSNGLIGIFSEETNEENHSWDSWEWTSTTRWLIVDFAIKGCPRLFTIPFDSTCCLQVVEVKGDHIPLAWRFSLPNRSCQPDLVLAVRRRSISCSISLEVFFLVLEIRNECFLVKGVFFVLRIRQLRYTIV